MSKTYIETDETLVRRAMELYGLRTKREAVALALRTLVGEADRSDMIELRGSGWDGDLDEMRDRRGG